MIGIIGAMEAEVAILKETMEIEEVVEYLYEWNFFGVIGDHGDIFSDSAWFGCHFLCEK